MALLEVNRKLDRHGLGNGAACSFKVAIFADVRRSF